MADLAKKQPFTVWEAQEVTEWRAFRYELRARSFEDAVERVQAGEVDPIDEGYVGESDLSGESGFALSHTEAVEALDRVLTAKEKVTQTKADDAEVDQDA